MADNDKMSELSLKEQFQFYLKKSFDKPELLPEGQVSEMEKAFMAGSSMNVVCFEESLPEDAYEALEVVKKLRAKNVDYWEGIIQGLNKKSFEQVDKQAQS